MLKNKIFAVSFFLFFAVCLEAKTIFAQAVTDNSAVNITTNAQGTQAAENPSLLPAQEPAPKIVKAIDIRGNKSIGIAQILSRIKTRVGEPYQEAVISDDLKRLYNTGHFSDVEIDHEDLAGGFKIIVQVKEKPIIDQITFSKIKFYKPNYLLNKMKTKKDKFLDNKILKDDINMIVDLYKKKGLTQVKVDVETFLDEAMNKISLHFIIQEGYKMRIKRIYVYGNTSYSDKKIIKVMKSRWAWVFGSGLLKQDVLDQDMDAIHAFYEKNGYIDAKASFQLESLYKGWVNVNVIVNEGKRYYVGEVTFTGNVVMLDADIKSHLKNLKEGNVFSHEKLEEDIDNIREAYFDRGYIAADVQEATSFNVETTKVDVKISIKEGHLTYISKIKIQGNTNTRDIVIRRELRMYPGEQFNGEKLRLSKQRLKDLGYFEDVGYDIEDTNQEDYKDLVVQVKESKTGTFSFGGGYSTVERLIGFVEIEQKNFDIANWPSFTGGGQDLRLRAQIGSVQRDFVLSFTEPWIFDHPITGGFDIYYTQNLKDSTTGYSYDQKTLGGDLRLSKDLTDHFNVGGVYRLERITISNLDSGVSDALAEQAGSAWISSFGVSTTFDYRDSKLAPTRGWIVTDEADIAGGPLGGDKNFYRLQTSGSYYVPLPVHDFKTVLELSARTGIVQSYPDTPDVPIYERYFTGGQDSIRGYDERSVGPHDPNTGDAIGGNAMLVGSVEYTVPIIDIIKGALFYDIGDVWDKVRNYGSGGLKSGVGVGLRVKTPIGPIKLDYGIPLNKEQGQKKSGKFYFSVSRGF